jgi:hypothetical protein
VRVTVLDVMGRELVLLADADFPAGRQEITWDAGDRGRLPAGLYFVRAQAEGRSFSRRIVLMW